MKNKKLKISIIASLIAAILCSAALTVYAYFTTRVYVYTEDGNKEIAHVGMNLQLLFGKLAVADGTALKIPGYSTSGGYLVYNDGVTEGQTTTFDSKAQWGTRQNPYVISDTRHMQNLSALHSVGYFDLMYISHNFNENGEYIEGSAFIPYFLVCTEKGEPVVIDGSELEGTIKPIGSAEHPFIGVIGGAFVTETTDANDKTVPITATIGKGDNAKTTSVSAIHNFKVQTNTDQTDVGLFGYVGFLGVEPTDDAIASNPQFVGVASSIKNLLISDVQVVVKRPSLTEIVSELFGPLWAKYFGTDKDGNTIYHRYSFTNLTPAASKAPHPEETHHIGIFAGHVSYAHIDNISVYYSSESVRAIDLTGTSTADNYYSASGILGMLYNMNCKIANVKNEADAVTGNCVIKIGTGTTSENSGNVTEGTGTGGGIYSGSGRGYVTAAEIFTTFNNVNVLGESNNELIWRYKNSYDGKWIENAILILKDEDGTYKLADGKTEATITSKEVTLEGGTKKIEYTVTAGKKSWTNFFIREIAEREYGNEFKYVTPSGGVVYECEMMGNKCNGQVVWKFSAGGDGIWHYGIRVTESVVIETDGTRGDPVYKLDDGTVVYLVDGTIRTDRTAANATVWQNFFISKTVTTKVEGEDGKISANTVVSHYMYDPITESSEWTVTEFERKPLPLIEAYGVNKKTGEMEKLCVHWQMPTANGDVASGLYYFYDGVFTFGLSSREDTIRDTWKNSLAATLYLGSNKDEDWKVNEDRTGNRTLVALLNVVTTNRELNDAIAAGKQFYISAQPDNDKAYFMSLLTDNGSQEVLAEKDDDGNLIYKTQTTPGMIPDTQVFLENTLKDELLQYYKTGAYKQIPTVPKTGQTKDQPMADVTLEQMQDIAFWNQFDTVLNIGRTSSVLALDALKSQYNIVPTNVLENGEIKYYYYRNDTGAYVGTAAGNNSINSNNPGKITDYIEYKEYIYYTVDYVVDENGYTYGRDSGTPYEDKRTYTFTFYYQPPNKAEPVPLGYTTVKVDAYTMDTAYGSEKPIMVSYMPDFQYGMVFFGQNNTSTNTSQTNPNTFYTRVNGQGGNSTLVASSSLYAGVKISPVVSGNAYDPNDDGDYVFDLSYSAKGINATNIPMVNITANRFHGNRFTTDAQATQAILSEGVASKKSTGTVDYYYYDVTTGKYYCYEDNEWVDKGTTAPTVSIDPETGKVSKVLLNRYPAYTFASNNAEAPSYLQFLHQFIRWNYYFGNHGDSYSLWAGTEAQYKELPLKKGSTTVTNSSSSKNYKSTTIYEWFTEGVLVFEPGQNYCYIQYTYDKRVDDWYEGKGNALPNSYAKDEEIYGYKEPSKSNHSLTQYVGYTYDAETGNLQYTLSATKTKLYVYVIEGILDTATGVNTFIPEDLGEEDSNSLALDADQVVFWPQTTLKQNGVYKNNGVTLVANSTENAAMTKTNDPIYTIKTLADLNWGTAEGYKLTDYGLDKKFQMADQGFFGKLHIDENGDVSSVSNSNMMIVPVGSEDVESPIPKGCVAFSVNAKSKQTVRIIVAVPTSTYYFGENDVLDPLDFVHDYYVGVWKVPTLTPGQEVTFKKSEALEKFELPRSYSFGFSDTPEKLEKDSVKHYVEVEYNGAQYRTYLNGDVFLVAYEFTIDGAETGGTYIIGSAHGEDSTMNSTKDIPMEIVHFSVSGTASAGRDGVQGNQLGAIDFVYHNPVNSSIITVGSKSATNSLPNATGTEYYSSYQASLILLHTNNEKKLSETSTEYVKINQAEVYIQRRLDSTGTGDSTTYKTVISYYITSDDPNQTDAFKIKSYGGNNCDTLNERTQASGSSSE